MKYFIPLLLLTACSGERIDNPPQPNTRIQLPPIEWRVLSEKDLRAEYVAAGAPLTKTQKLHGFVGTHGSKIVVYTMPPTHVDDDATLTLGHEIMHVALGEYHTFTDNQGEVK